jgi:hypothetical protein
MQVAALRDFAEATDVFRYARAANPIFRYDYKLGNYFTKDDLLTKPFLYTTVTELTGGIRKASWFFSQKFIDLYKAQFATLQQVLKAPQSGLLAPDTVAGLPTHSI